MYAVTFPCPRCAVERTMRQSDGRPVCVNCLLRRRGGPTAPVRRPPATGPAYRPSYPFGSVA